MAPRLHIIVGSTRPGRIGPAIAAWFEDFAAGHGQFEPELVDLADLGLPVLAHLGFGKRGDFRAICHEYPRLDLIAAHAGFPFFKDLWRYKSECPNLHVDLSSPYLNEKLARQAVKAMGPERCLYGTDAPYGFHDDDGTYDYGTIKAWVERMPISSAEQERIFGDNFAALVDT